MKQAKFMIYRVRWDPLAANPFKLTSPSRLPSLFSNNVFELNTNSGNADIYSNKNIVRVKTGAIPFPCYAFFLNNQRSIFDSPIHSRANMLTAVQLGDSFSRTASSLLSNRKQTLRQSLFHSSNSLYAVDSMPS
nr:hypothetical protein Iba_chr05aCG8990 [Ipomoea batatas]